MSSAINGKSSPSLGLAAVVAMAILTSACGGGGGSAPAPVSPPPSGPPAAPPPGTPVVDATTGLYGKCASLQGATTSGFIIGYCSSAFTTASPTGTVYEGVYLNVNVASTVSSGTGGKPVYQYTFPTAWGGTKSYQDGIDNYLGLSAIAGSRVGYTIVASASRPGDASDSTSLVDFGGLISTGSGTAAVPSKVSFGLFGRSILASDVYYGGFYAGAPGVSKASSLSSLGTSAVNYSGLGASHYLRSAPTVAPDTEKAVQSVSHVVNLQVNPTTNAVSGTLTTFEVRVGNAAVSAPIANQTFAGTWSAATGLFTAEMSGANTIKVEGAFYGPNAEEFSAKFAGRTADGKYLAGGFGGRR